MTRLLWLILLSIQTSFACDLCNLYMGSEPHDYRNTLGLRIRHSVYTAEANHRMLGKALHAGAADREYFTTVELWSKYYLTRRLQVHAIVPLRFNRSESEPAINRLGDIVVATQYEIFGNLSQSINGWGHRLTLGGGLKIPTGAYRIHHSSEAIDPHIQAGTGSWDALATAAYVGKYGLHGFQTQATYSMTTANDNNFRFANRLNASTLFFRQFLLRKTVLTPSSGLYLEHARHDILDGMALPETGGTMLLWQSGVDGYFNDVAMAATVQVPVYQRVGEAKNEYRVSFGLQYSFESK